LRSPRAVPPRSSGADASQDWKRTTVRAFRYVRPHAGRFDLRFHDEEALEALAELVEYREAWRSKLEAVRREADEGRVRIADADAGPERDGVARISFAVRSLVRRPSREAVLLTYELEDLRRTLETLDDAIRRLEAYVAARRPLDEPPVRSG
jgi:hypothetical protein